MTCDDYSLLKKAVQSHVQTYLLRCTDEGHIYIQLRIKKTFEIRANNFLVRKSSNLYVSFWKIYHGQWSDVFFENRRASLTQSAIGIIKNTKKARPRGDRTCIDIFSVLFTFLLKDKGVLFNYLRNPPITALRVTGGWWKLRSVAETAENISKRPWTSYILREIPTTVLPAAPRMLPWRRSAILPPRQDFIHPFLPPRRVCVFISGVELLFRCYVRRCRLVENSPIFLLTANGIWVGSCAIIQRCSRQI